MTRRSLEEQILSLPVYRPPQNPRLIGGYVWLGSVLEIVRAHDPQPQIVARPAAEWHEDDGPALWWRFPIMEPPYCGTPLDEGWPGNLTHWTPIEAPASPVPEPVTEPHGEQISEVWRGILARPWLYDQVVAVCTDILGMPVEQATPIAMKIEKRGGSRGSTDPAHLMFLVRNEVR